MKRVLKMLLAMMLCMVALFGCSNSDGKDEEPETTTAAIKIGGSGPLTGGAAEYGMAVKNAATIAVEEINAKGGLQFELDFEDDAHDAETAVNAYGVLKDWGMQVSLLCVTSAPCNAVADMYQEDGIFALTPSGSNADITANRDLIFQMCFTDPNQGAESAVYFSEHFADKKIAVIYQSDIEYSAGVYASFKSEAEELKLNVVYTGAFIKDDVDFTQLLTDAKNAGATIVFLPIYYTEAAQILTQANTLGYAPTFFGVDGMDGILNVEGFDTKLAEGVYLLTPFAADADDEATQAFVSKYEEEFGTTPNQFAADAYDAVYAIYQACVNGNVTADMTAQEIGKIMQEQFTTMTFNGLKGSDVTWKTTGEVSKAPMAVVIKDGVYVSAED